MPCLVWRLSTVARAPSVEGWQKTTLLTRLWRRAMEHMWQGSWYRYTSQPVHRYPEPGHPPHIQLVLDIQIDGECPPGLRLLVSAGCRKAPPPCRAATLSMRIMAVWWRGWEVSGSALAITSPALSSSRPPLLSSHWDMVANTF